MLKDIERSCQFYGLIPLQTPSKFPVMTLSTQRLLTSVSVHAPDKLETLSREFWLSYWSRDEDISTVEVMKKCCESVGFSTENAEKLLALSQTPEIKQQLLATTEEAVNRGAFGAPTFFVQKDASDPEQMYFGGDRFPFVFKQLGLEFKEPYTQCQARL